MVVHVKQRVQQGKPLFAVHQHGLHAELLEFACSRKEMEQFYRPYIKECPGVLYDELPADKGVSVYPPLWSEAGNDPRSTAAVSMKELQDVEIEVMKKLNSQDNAEPNDGGAE